MAGIGNVSSVIRTEQAAAKAALSVAVQRQLRDGMADLVTMSPEAKVAFGEQCASALAKLEGQGGLSAAETELKSQLKTTLDYLDNSKPAGWSPGQRRVNPRENFGMTSEQMATRNKMLLAEAGLSFTPAAAVTVPHMMLDSAVGVLHGALTGNVGEMASEAVGLVPWGKSVQVLKAAGKLKQVAPLIDAALEKGHGLGVVSKELMAKVQLAATDLLKKGAEQLPALEENGKQFVEGGKQLVQGGEKLVENASNALAQSADDLLTKAEGLVAGTDDVAKTATTATNATETAANTAQTASGAGQNSVSQMGAGKPGAPGVVEPFSPKALEMAEPEALQLMIKEAKDLRPTDAANCMEALATKLSATRDPANVLKARQLRMDASIQRSKATANANGQASETVARQMAINTAHSLAPQAEAALAKGDFKQAGELFEQASNAAEKSFNMDVAATMAKKAAESFAKVGSDRAPAMFQRAATGRVREMMQWKLPETAVTGGRLATPEAIKAATPESLKSGVEMFARSNNPDGVRQLVGQWMNKFPKNGEARGNAGSSLATSLYEQAKALKAGGDVVGGKQLAKTAATVLEEIQKYGGASQVKVNFGGELQRWSWDEAIGSLMTLAK